jgi:hypothetical protein
MRRPALVTIIVLGSVVTLVGATGIYAEFTDRATTGTNRATSGERPRAADLKIAFTDSSFNDCQQFVDDLATGVFTVNDMQPGDKRSAYVCLRNAGSSTLAVTADVIDLVDQEVGCTGDEQAAGDTTCGTGAGELSTAVAAYANRLDCTTGIGTPADGDRLSTLAGPKTLPIGSLSAGETTCVDLEIMYGLNLSDTDVLIAQSDQVTWRFAFDGSAA